MCENLCHYCVPALYHLLLREQTLPIYKLPGIGQIPHNLHGDQHLLFNVDCANHLVHELARVSQELTHLKVRLQLVELLHLNITEQKKRLLKTITIFHLFHNLY